MSVNCSSNQGTCSFNPLFFFFKLRLEVFYWNYIFGKVKKLYKVSFVYKDYNHKGNGSINPGSCVCL